MVIKIHIGQENIQYKLIEQKNLYIYKLIFKMAWGCFVVYILKFTFIFWLLNVVLS